MVEERVTDGKRIGQLLASELTGLERGPLGALAVEDARPDVEPTDGGALAYRVTRAGDTVATVEVTPSTARLCLTETVEPDVPAYAAVTVEQTQTGTVVVAHSGAAVKQLVEVLAGR